MQADTSPKHADRIKLTIGALGVVYGDIGTSPLYAIKECFHGIHAITPNPTNIMGVLSLITWSLTIVITIKYLMFIMQADNRGEGGIFALLALVSGSEKQLSNKTKPVVVFAALVGASLLYSDGFITPAISVLSAIEGLEVATHAADKLVVPLTCLVLLTLFLSQHHGTGGIGKIFGPIMLIWFAMIASLGISAILQNPHVLTAINPVYAWRFFAENNIHGLVVLGSVVLCITGGEALYADMGHFGPNPIRTSWFAFVFPALLLNYFGQGALLLDHPELSANPFYELVPRIILYPMVALSTMATIIASQAMISGAFSLTRQAVQMGYCPRVTIIHTSANTEGQIYIPEINRIMMVVCIGLVLAFRSSSGLAAAYGIAVTADMTITSLLYFFVATRTWGWPVQKAAPVVALFLIFDITYFGSNLLKIFDGGWFPIAVAVIIVILMTAWKDGRAALYQKMRSIMLSLDIFIEDVSKHGVHRVKGTAVFMASSSNFTPPSLLHHFKHNKVLHEQVIFLTIQPQVVPSILDSERLSFESFGHGFHRIIARYGFMETPNVPRIVNKAFQDEMMPHIRPISYYLGRETLVLTGKSKMSRWRLHIFSFLSRNSKSAVDYFGIPPGRVVELGGQIEL